MATAIVSRRIRAAARAHRALVAAESLLLAVSAALATLAAVRASGQEALGGQVLSIAVLASILAAGAWGLERRKNEASIARAIDRQAGLRGAVLTAFQAEASADPSPVAELLAARVDARVSVFRFLRDAARSSVPLLAVPFAALALWMLATEPERSSTAREVASPAEHLNALRSEAQRLQTRADLHGALREEARKIEDRAESLVAQTRTASPAASDLAPAERDLARRLELLKRAISIGEVTSAAPAGTMAGPGTGIERSPDTSMRAQEPTSNDADTPPEGRPPVPSSAVGNELGVVTSRWWPERYDTVVERWIESRRAGRDGRAR